MFDLLSNPFQLKKNCEGGTVFRIFLRYNYNIRNPSKLSIKEKTTCSYAHSLIDKVYGHSRNTITLVCCLLLTLKNSKSKDNRSQHARLLRQLQRSRQKKPNPRNFRILVADKINRLMVRSFVFLTLN